MYQDAFGLSAKPFQLTPDPAFYFGSKGHNRARAYLEYGLMQREGFIVMTGDIGSGKTTLAHGLIRAIETQGIVAASIVSTQVDADDLLRLVCRALGVDDSGGDKSLVLGRLESFFQALHASGRRVLLLVDEAQNLTPRAIEELRMLSNFQVGNQALVQSFLIGQPEFRYVMQRPEMQQLKQRVIASCHLGPLDAAEAREYIEHRLRHVGWKANPSIQESAFGSVYRHTNGMPRRINLLMDRVLLDCFLRKGHAISAEHVDLVAAEMASESGAPTLSAIGHVTSRTQSDGLRIGQPDPLSGVPVSLFQKLSGRPQTEIDQINARLQRLELLHASVHRVLARMVKKGEARSPEQQPEPSDS